MLMEVLVQLQGGNSIIWIQGMLPILQELIPVKYQGVLLFWGPPYIGFLSNAGSTFPLPHPDFSSSSDFHDKVNKQI